MSKLTVYEDFCNVFNIGLTLSVDPSVPDYVSIKKDGKLLMRHKVENLSHLRFGFEKDGTIYGQYSVAYDEKRHIVFVKSNSPVVKSTFNKTLIPGNIYNDEYYLDTVYLGKINGKNIFKSIKRDHYHNDRISDYKVIGFEPKYQEMLNEYIDKISYECIYLYKTGYGDVGIDFKKGSVSIFDSRNGKFTSRRRYRKSPEHFEGFDYTRIEPLFNCKYITIKPHFNKDPEQVKAIRKFLEDNK